MAGESGADDEAEIDEDVEEVEDSIAKASSEISGEFKPSAFSAIVASISPTLRKIFCVINSK